MVFDGQKDCNIVYNKSVVVLYDSKEIHYHDGINSTRTKRTALKATTVKHRWKKEQRCFRLPKHF